MKIIAMTAFMAFVAFQIFSQPASAAPKYKYCIQLGGDNTMCQYTTMQQCRAAASGLDADCILNPRMAFSKSKSGW